MAEPRAPREGLILRALLPAIVLLSAIGYLLTAPRWILGGDNGEFSTLYATGGIAHPPGYASMVIWLRLWHWLPVDTPAHGAALATVVLGVMAVWTVQRACLAWGASTAATAFASAVYAFSPMAWKMSCHAEVFAMNAMFAGAILALSAPAPRLHDSRLTFALGLLAGFAIGDQQSIVLLAPIGLLAAVRGVRAAKRPWMAASMGVVGLLAGLLPSCLYVYVVAKTSDPRTTPMWIEAPTLAGVFFHLRRGAYGTLSLAGIAVQSDPLGNLWLFAKNATRQMLGMPLIVLLAAALSIARNKHKTIGRRELVSLSLLFAAFLLAGPIFIARFNLPFVGAAPTVAERFYLFPEVILTVMGAFSLDAVVPWLMARDGLMAALVVQVALAASILTVPEVLEHNRPTVELYIKNTLRTAPKDALIVGTGDHRWGGFMYARYALHLRPDVLYLVPGTMTQAWYRRELQAMTGVSFETPLGGPVGPKTLMARLLATGRPLFYTDWPDLAVAATPHVTVGTLMRVLPEGEPPPSPETLEAANLEVFSSYQMESSPPADEHGWGYTLQPDYARPWLELARRYGEEGDARSEQACLARAAELAPWTVKVGRPW
jgi:Protein of unknown function (DUF2723)